MNLGRTDDPRPPETLELDDLLRIYRFGRTVMTTEQVVEVQSGIVLLRGVRLIHAGYVRGIVIHRKGVAHRFSAPEVHTISKNVPMMCFFDRGSLTRADPLIMTAGDRIEISRFPSFGCMTLTLEVSIGTNLGGWRS